MIDGVTWCVLGGGAAERELHPRVIDMERIDPDQVVLPRVVPAEPAPGRPTSPS